MTWTPTFGNAQDLGFSNTYTSPTVNLGTGFAVVGFVTNQDMSTGTTVTIAGVTATFLGESTNSNLFLFGAAISSATGVVSATIGGAFAAMSCSGGVLTGFNTTPTNIYSGAGGLQFDPQQLTGTIAAGGIGILLGGAYQAAANIQTLSWSGATADAVTNANVTGGGSGTSAGSGMAHSTTAGSQTIGVSGGAGTLDFSGGILMAVFTASGGSAPPNGWFGEPDDLPKGSGLRARSFDALPAIALIPSTLPPRIAGMAWLERHDQRDRSARIFLDAPPAFGKVPTAGPAIVTGGLFTALDLTLPKKRILDNDGDAPAGSPFFLPPRIAGMAWFAPRDRDVPARVVATTDPPPLIFQPPLVTWSFVASDTVFLREPPADAGLAFGKPPTAQTVPISGMAWFEPPDRDRPAIKVTFEAPAAIALIPGTLPPKIAGMAWFEPAPDTTVARKGVDAPPAFGRAIGAAPNTIAGMAWASPQDAQRAPRVVLDVAAPAAVLYAPQTLSTAWLVHQDVFRPTLRISDSAPAGVFTLQSVAVGGLFNQADALPPRSRGRIGDVAPAFGRSFAAPVPISGMAWFEPLDEKPRAHLGRDEPAAFGYPYVQNVTFTLSARLITLGSEIREITAR